MSRRPGRALRVVVLHADEDLLVVDKPPGVLSVPGRGSSPNLFDEIRALPDLADDEPLRVVHRLDRDASGILVYARTLEAQRQLVRQFERRCVEKVYHAIVSGYVAEDGDVELPIRYDKRSGRFLVTTGRGKSAATRYRVLERVAGNTLLECRPLTGRTHQIRLHMDAIGHPLSVDPQYGGGERLMLSTYKPDYRRGRGREERSLIDRLTLHASSIRFVHPRHGGTVQFESGLPRDFRTTLTQLGRLTGGC